MSKLRALPHITAQRLLRDARDLQDDPLASHGIYYRADETNILKGYALIVGSKGTPYYGGYYFFEFNFGTNYPFSPPVVTFRTNQHSVRFNPNLYASGRVCLSVLNTWMEEQWGACQTVSSVLLVLASVLCENPMLNEPSVNIDNVQLLQDYARTVEYSNINIAMCNIMQREGGLHMAFFDLFRPIMIEQWREHYDDVRALCISLLEKWGADDMDVPHYYNNGMRIRINYARLLDKLDAVNRTIP
jgi:ubiquitin-protein ligase